MKEIEILGDNRFETFTKAGGCYAEAVRSKVRLPKSVVSGKLKKRPA